MLSQRSVTGSGSDSGSLRSGSPPGACCPRSSARCLPRSPVLSISKRRETGCLDAGPGARREGGNSSARLPLRKGRARGKSSSGNSSARLPLRKGRARAKSSSPSIAAVPCEPTAPRPPRALTGENWGSEIMLSARLLLRLRRRVVMGLGRRDGRALPSTIRLDALALLLAESLCGARCSAVKQVGSSVQRAAV